MEEKEYSNVYSIPANYTDSGKIMGMLETRNTIEAIALVCLLGYPEIAWLPLETTAKVVVVTVTLIPLGIVALMGIGGDSLLQFVNHVVKFGLNRRKLHFRRIGYKYGHAKQKGKTRKKPKKKEKQ